MSWMISSAVEERLPPGGQARTGWPAPLL